MKDEDHRSEPVVSGSVGRKGYCRLNNPMDPLGKESLFRSNFGFLSVCLTSLVFWS